MITRVGGRRAIAAAAISVISVVAVTLSGAPLASAAGRARAASSPPDDPGLALQWGLADIGAPVAWAAADGTGTTIAIVDSGVDLAHEDLSNKIVASVDCIGSGGDPTKCIDGGGGDDDGHGTHVAGIAAAVTGNGRGVAGVAPGASLMAVRVLQHTCDVLGNCTASGTASAVVAGVRWAADHGADVINLSLGGSTQAVLGPEFADAVSYAWDEGAIPVVSAGNQFVLGSGFSDEPALVVSAVGRDDAKAGYSNGVGQAKWGIAAPGGDGDDTATDCRTGGEPHTILSTYWQPDWGPNVYACLAGTSMAAPHVSGAAAVLRSAGLTQEQTVDRLLDTAKDLGSAGPDSTFGAGRVDLAHAVEGLGGGEDSTTTTVAMSTSAPSSTVTPTTAPPTTQAPPTAAPPAAPGTVPEPPAGVATAAEIGLTTNTGENRDDLPSAPVAVAVLLVVLAAGGNTWWTFRHASWARRTPGP